MVFTSNNSAPEQIWTGGFYEIEFDLETSSDEYLGDALGAIWGNPSLEGGYLSRDQKFKDQIKVDPRQCVGDGHLYGLATLPNGGRVACGTTVCKLETADALSMRNLVSFYMPLGDLAKFLDVGGYPFSDFDRAPAWRDLLDDWLVNLARSIYKLTEFRLALVGFEVDFPNLTFETIERDGIPSKRYDGYLVQMKGRLEWFPPTNYDIIRIT